MNPDILTLVNYCEEFEKNNPNMDYDKLYQKLEVDELECGDKLEIHWHGDYEHLETDIGYVFTLPSAGCIDEMDFFVHVPATSDNTEVWRHIYELLNNDFIEKITKY